MSIFIKLASVQAELKAPKGQFNSFGKYKYRSCEDILEAVKPLLHKYELGMSINDDMMEVGGRVYVMATVTVFDYDGNLHSVSASAREEETKKGMDASQVTGATSSYARKYALNGMFLIDDTKDSDATNTHGNEPAQSHGRVPVGGAAARDAIAEEESESESGLSIMDKAVAYLKAARNRTEAYDSVMKHYGQQLTEAQKGALKKFVR
jgi:hypothetical protein